MMKCKKCGGIKPPKAELCLECSGKEGSKRGNGDGELWD